MRLKYLTIWIYALQYTKSLGKAGDSVAESAKSSQKPNNLKFLRSVQIHGNVLYCFGLRLEGALQLAFAALGVVGQDSSMSTHHPLQQVSSLTNLDHAADKVFDTCPHRQTAHEIQTGQLHAVIAWRHDCMTSKLNQDSTKTIIIVIRCN